MTIKAGWEKDGIVNMNIRVLSNDAVFVQWQENGKAYDAAFIDWATFVTWLKTKVIND